MTDKPEILACGHPYILNETMVHCLPSCMKCHLCCTCRRLSDIRKDFDEAAAKIGEALGVVKQLGDAVKKASMKKMTKAELQKLEDNPEIYG